MDKKDINKRLNTDPISVPVSMEQLLELTKKSEEDPDFDMAEAFQKLFNENKDIADQ